MGRNSSGDAWRPSKGTYGWLGTHSKSEAGKRRRGKTSDKAADSVKEGANEALTTLMRQFKRSSGTGDEPSTYQKQLDLEVDAAGVEEESFLADVDRQASALTDATANQTKAIETQQAQTGFAGSGSTGRARQDLARSIQEKGEAIYADLDMKMGAQDIEMDKKLLGAETELENELDRIQIEASGIINQTQQALDSMEKTAVASAYKYKPIHPLSEFDPTKVDTQLDIG